MTVARSLALPVAALLAPGLAAPAALAGERAITGTLSSPRFEVIALDDAGRARAARPDAKGRFRVVPTAPRVTLQLRSTGGVYAGPVVVASAPTLVVEERGRRTKYERVIMGVRAGADLGRIVVRDGYGDTVRRPAANELDTSRLAFAKRRRPCGARRRGRCQKPSTGVRGGVDAQSRPGVDPDADGIPSGIDPDDDGDLVFDNVDGSVRRYEPGSLDSPFQVISLMNFGLEESYLSDRFGHTQNAAGFPLNAYTRPPGNDFERLQDIALEQRGLLLFPLPRGDTELDCAALSYCSLTGRGRVLDGRLFPRDFDADGDGFGLMEPAPPFNPARDGFGTTRLLDPDTDRFALVPRAPLRRTERAAGVGTGDTYLKRTASAEGEQTRPVTLSYVFVTVPAIVAYDDGQGKRALRLPAALGAPGGESDPIRVVGAARRVLRLTVRRPQRLAYPGRPAARRTRRRVTSTWTSGGWSPVCRQDYRERPSPLLLPAEHVQRALRRPPRPGHDHPRGLQDGAPDRTLNGARAPTFTSTCPAVRSPVGGECAGTRVSTSTCVASTRAATPPRAAAGLVQERVVGLLRRARASTGARFSGRPRTSRRRARAARRAPRAGACASTRAAAAKADLAGHRLDARGGVRGVADRRVLQARSPPRCPKHGPAVAADHRPEGFVDAALAQPLVPRGAATKGARPASPVPRRRRGPRGRPAPAARRRPP